MNYIDYMDDVLPAVKLGTKIIYEQYAKPLGKTKQQFIDDCVRAGFEGYKEYKNYKGDMTLEEGIADLMSGLEGLSRNDCISTFHTKGLIDISMSKLGCDSAMELFEKYEKQYKDEIDELFMS